MVTWTTYDTLLFFTHAEYVSICFCIGTEGLLMAGALDTAAI